MVYIDSHDYGPNKSSTRYTGGTDAWAENMSLMWTFRVVPTLFYGSEIEFQAGKQIDCGPTCPLASTGRAYFGDQIEGTVVTSDFGKVQSATGVDSFALITVSGSATFSNIPNGTYKDAITDNVITVTNGTLTANVSGKGNLRVYVLDLPGDPAPGKIGEDGPYLKP